MPCDAGEGLHHPATFPFISENGSSSVMGPESKPSKLCPHPPTDNSEMTRVKMAALIILAKAPQAPSAEGLLGHIPTPDHA